VSDPHAASQMTHRQLSSAGDDQCVQLPTATVPIIQEQTSSAQQELQDQLSTQTESSPEAFPIQGQIEHAHLEVQWAYEQLVEQQAHQTSQAEDPSSSPATGQNEHGNLHIGMALLPENIDIDPGYEAFCFDHNAHEVSPRQSPDGIKLWAKHFAPIDRQSGINIPPSWSDLFTLALLNPAKFDWAKSVLGSKAWELILTDKDSEATITFSIPNKCPVKKALICEQMEDEEGLVADEKTPTLEGHHSWENTSVSTSALHIKRKKAKAPLVSTEVRRSERLKKKNLGYKASSCNGRNCLCYDTEPPALSNRTIRNLGKEFCKIPAQMLTEESLKRRNKGKTTVSGPVKPSKAKKTNSNSNAESPKKKSRKN
jgi:hypothetical protein